MTLRDLLGAMCDENEHGALKVGVYDAAITNASRGKNGLTTITVKVRVREFTPDDVMRGVKAYLALGTMVPAPRPQTDVLRGALPAECVGRAFRVAAGGSQATTA